VTEPAPTPNARRELDRVEAFSDGVFAIAITLLVLNINVPDVPGGELGSAISDLAETDPQAPAKTLLGALRRAMVFFVSIPIAYAISPSLAQWFWLLLIVVSRADRRLGVTRRS
jgi:hypothetical protein